jgi:hypothetical protein
MRWRLRFLTDRPRPLHGSSALPGYGLGKPEYPTKPFSGADEAGPKPRSAIRRPDSKTGCVKMMEAVTVPSGKWLELGVGAFSGNMKVSFQAARSIG